MGAGSAHRARLVGAVAWPLLVVAVAGCSSGDDRARSEPSAAYSFAETVAADEICDGAITGDAARLLERLAGGTEFSEVEGLPRADLGEFAAELAEPDTFTETFCDIYSTTYGTHPLVSFRFFWLDHESRDGTEPADGGLLYETGDSAFVEDRSAYIRFPCPVRQVEEGELLFASLLLVASDAATDPDAMMAVLNSVSSALAAELGCPDTGLTTTPPQRVPVG